MSQPSPTSPPPAGDGAPRLTIERLRLRAAGLDEGTARQLATLVGQALAPALQLPVGVTAIDTLRVDMATHPGEGPEALSRRIVDAVGRALARDRAPAGTGVLGGEEVAP